MDGFKGELVVDGLLGVIVRGNGTLDCRRKDGQVCWGAKRREHSQRFYSAPDAAFASAARNSLLPWRSVVLRIQPGIDKFLRLLVDLIFQLATSGTEIICKYQMSVSK